MQRRTDMSFSAQHWILRKLSKYRGFFYVPPFIFMVFTFYKECEDDSIIWPLVITIIFVGALIRLWATKHIGRRMPWMKRKGKKLVRTGPYAIVRNPLYIGNIIIASGLSIFSELIWMIPILIFYLFILYHLVVLYEEKKLLVRWGDKYQAYLIEVPRWIPRLREFNKCKAKGFKWIDSLRSELPSLLLLLFGIFVFFAKEIFSPIFG
jgi:protein-S-isoprenylcysteine O-methyltransferase Ste14